MTQIIEVTAATFDDVVRGSAVPVLVEYWARGCGPCRMLTPILREIAADHAETLRIVTVDGDNELDLLASAGVMGFPTMHLYRDGELVSSILGVRSKATLVDHLADVLRPTGAAAAGQWSAARRC